MLRQLLISAVLIATAAPYAVAGDSADSDSTDWINDASGVGSGKKEKGPEWIKDTSGIGQSKNGVVRSDQILELGTCPPSALQLEGEHSLRLGNIEAALTALQRSVELAPLDMEKRLLYCEALEKKLMSMKNKKDPALYNFLIKQYLFISRKAEFVDQTMQARSHLVHLTGTQPKPFERSTTFLNRVMIPEDGSSEVAIKGKNAPPAQ